MSGYPKPRSNMPDSFYCPMFWNWQWVFVV